MNSKGKCKFSSQISANSHLSNYLFLAFFCRKYFEPNDRKTGSKTGRLWSKKGNLKYCSHFTCSTAAAAHTIIGIEFISSWLSVMPPRPTGPSSLPLALWRRHCLFCSNLLHNSLKFNEEESESIAREFPKTKQIQMGPKLPIRWRQFTLNECEIGKGMKIEDECVWRERESQRQKNKHCWKGGPRPTLTSFGWIS